MRVRSLIVAVGAALAALAVSAGPALADGDMPLHAGVGLQHWTVSDLGVDYSGNGIALRAGQDVVSLDPVNIGWEGMIAFGGSESVTGPGGKFEFSQQYTVSALGRASYPFLDRFSGYALLGLSYLSFKSELTGSPIPAFNFSDTVTDTGISFGIGADALVTDNISVAAEWLTLNSDISTLNLLVNWLFL